MANLNEQDVIHMHTIEKPERAKPMDDGQDGKTLIWTVNEGTKREV